jgi:hypothetical protein
VEFPKWIRRIDIDVDIDMDIDIDIDEHDGLTILQSLSVSARVPKCAHFRAIRQK